MRAVLNGCRRVRPSCRALPPEKQGEYVGAWKAADGAFSDCKCPCGSQELRGCQHGKEMRCNRLRSVHKEVTCQADQRRQVCATTYRNQHVLEIDVALGAETVPVRGLLRQLMLREDEEEGSPRSGEPAAHRDQNGALRRG